METWMFSYILMALLCVLSFFQPTWQRMTICLVFSIFQVFHAIVSEYFSDTMYYLSDGTLASILLVGIVWYAKPNKFTDKMGAICLASVFLNIYGVIIYENSWKADSYNVAFYMLYMVVAFIFTQKEGVTDGEDARDCSFFLPYRKRDNLCRTLHQEEKN